MKICVYGAGAIGGLIAARLSASGESVSVVARGNTLKAVQQRGIGLSEAGDTRFFPVRAVAEPAQCGVQDLVVIAVKQPALNAILPDIKPLLGPDTRVLLAMNGVPWWFFDGLPGAPENRWLKTVDPDHNLSSYLPTERIIGCVVHISATTPEPGLSQLHQGSRLILGDPAGGCSRSTRQIGERLTRAGFDVELSQSIQKDIWFKLWGNMTMNPVSALTGATTDRILADPQVREFCSRAMQEAAAIGAAFGCVVPQTPEERHLATLKLGAMKTSMLQDQNAGRPLEYEALIGVVHEIAQKVGVDAPNIAALYGLIRLRAHNGLSD